MTGGKKRYIANEIHLQLVHMDLAIDFQQRRYVQSAPFNSPSLPTVAPHYPSAQHPGLNNDNDDS